MDMIIHSPILPVQQSREKDTANDLVALATQAALEQQLIARRLAKSQEQSVRGEDATDEVNDFFAKWSLYEGQMDAGGKGKPLSNALEGFRFNGALRTIS
ncbi:MAG: hypothetical protein HQL76_01595 [Magnetococcales bacterium]|nr:hypothetical protein [Magnetococcales bacterium]